MYSNLLHSGLSWEGAGISFSGAGKEELCGTERMASGDFNERIG